MRNLISVGQLIMHNVTFDAGAWKITKRAMVVVRENKYGTLYIIFNCRDMVAVADSAVSSDL